jgi:3-phenylpropionate/trans-cinnamate dioxygenase ferredoxin reductase subunit
VSAGTLIVGASQAGLQLAVSLREAGSQDPITLIGAEVHPPYQRPPLSKAFLNDPADTGTLMLRNEAFYAQQAIDVICGERVTGLRLSTGGSGTATTDRGRTIEFDKLALTVGARPRRLALPGGDLERVSYLRDVEDAVRIRDQLADASTVVVIGGGFIGLEAAAVARSQGKTVTVVEAADRLIPRAVAPLVSEFYRQAHERRGVTVQLNAVVAGLTGEQGRVAGVDLADGRHLPADLVLVGVGVAPRTELAEQVGLLCDGGIVVDAFARTSNPAVVAAGDCTVLPNPLTGVGRVRLESVQNAVSQAKVAAATLVGRPEPYTAVPWFWSDQYELKLQIAGLSTGYDDVVLRGDPADEKFSVLYYRAGELLAVDAVNTVADYLTVRKALAGGSTIPAAQARQADVPLKNLLVPRVVPA